MVGGFVLIENGADGCVLEVGTASWKEDVNKEFVSLLDVVWFILGVNVNGTFGLTEAKEDTPFVELLGPDGTASSVGLLQRQDDSCDRGARGEVRRSRLGLPVAPDTESSGTFIVRQSCCRKKGYPELQVPGPPILSRKGLVDG